MFKALKELDSRLKSPVQLLIGGGAAMLLAHKVPLSTMDIDAIPMRTQVEPAELDALAKKVGRDLKISPHWLTGFFGTFTYTIPPDYEKRLVEVYSGKNLKAVALGLEDLLIMKCFSRREKDIGHARALVRRGADLDLVEGHIQKLLGKELPGAKEAIDFLDDVRDQEGK